MHERVRSSRKSAEGPPLSEMDILTKAASGDDVQLRRMISRRGFGEPLPYVTGEIDKGGRTFFIDRRCYIPDEDTQMLVDALVHDACCTTGTILEFGTGCGWMAISVKLRIPSAQVVACDLDPSVLDLARLNSRRHRANVHFLESAYADDLPVTEPDFILADLPYGGDADYSEEEKRVRPFLPPTAVYPREGAMHCYIEAVESARKRGWRSKIYMETGYLSEDRVKAALGTVGVEYRQIKVNYSITVVDLSKVAFS
ncbi:methyltransferase [Gibbsiella quercinecans]|uniref:methyltransferase n=1 Tax=Gibbsiella quercinecans TaxID=929813 RepID=UPI003A4E1192